MTTLYREFHIDGRTIKPIVQALRAFWENAVVPLVGQGKRVLLIVTSDDAKRNSQQNRRLWGYTYKHIAEQAWANGQQFSAEVWHEYLARKFGVLEEMTLPDGEIITKRKSTTDYTVGEFADYMNEVEVHAAQELGVVWPA